MAQLSRAAAKLERLVAENPYAAGLAEHHIDAELFPRQLCRIALGANADAVAVDHALLDARAGRGALGRDLAVEPLVALLQVEPVELSVITPFHVLTSFDALDSNDRGAPQRFSGR